MGRQPRASASLASIALTAAVAALIAGAGAAAIDALWSWRELGQFTGFSGKLGALAYLTISYALAAAALAPLFAIATVTVWRASGLGGAIAALRARSPQAPLAMAIAVAPCVALLLVVTFTVVSPSLVNRKHAGLVVASAMAAGVIAVIVGIGCGILFARILEPLLARLDGALAKLTGTQRSVLGGSNIALLGLAVALAASGAAIASRAWETVSLLNLRPALLVCLIIAFAIACRGAAARLASRLSRLRHSALVASVAIGLLLAAMLELGSADPVRKAALARSGLGSPITQAARFVFDLDRDGASRVLGGGDCDDWNSEVGPTRPEIPGDGIDNNCVGGDVSLTRDPAAAKFAALPEALPSDFNVILITIDTLRADHLGAYGYKRETSPSLDALAADGTLFENAWAHAPSTRYSIPAILTGRLPLSVEYFTIRGGWPGLAPENTTLADIHKEAGFATGAILNYWYFEERRKMNRSFDHYDNKNRVLHKGVKGEGPAQTTGTSSKQQTDKAIEYIGARRDGERFFLWVHYYDPHFAYEIHKETKQFGKGKVARYDNEIRFTDDQIGRLIADLKTKGIYDKTVVVVTGDHGEGFGEHGIDLHGYHLYAAQTQVPLIIRVPGTPPSRVKTPAAHVDILPTLTNLTGGSPSSEMDGISLVGHITGESPRDGDRVIFQELSFENNNEMRAAASMDCHVIFNVSPNRSWETYRIDRDPREATDLTGTGECSETRRALEAFYDRSGIEADAGSALLPTRPTFADELGATFGELATLLHAALPKSISRSGSAGITLTWAAIGSTDDAWKVFVHLEGEGLGKSGFLQADHAPARPTTWWQKGQTIQYERPIHISSSARPGRYKVWLGLFRGKERMDISKDGKPVGDRVLLGTIAVTP